MHRVQLTLTLGLCALLGALNRTAHGQTCNFGELLTNGCDVAKVIPGTPGQHVVYADVSNASVTSTRCGGLTSGNEVWFEVTPTTSGLMTISTCHPNTLYDTVLEVFEGGDSGCDFMSQVACNDDTMDPECGINCASSSGKASQVTISVTASTRYRFVVGSFGNNVAGCLTCLGVIVTIDGTCGDPPRNFICQSARQLSGSPGTHEVFIDANDMPSFPEVWPATCTSASNVGSNLWFMFTSAVNGIARFSTCNFNTGYDTVARAMVGTCGGQMAQVVCNDDTDLTACNNACSFSPVGSLLTFPVTQGADYYLEVGSYNDNAVACPQCLDATLEITDCDTASAPVAAITAPTDFGCQCSNGPIVGSAFLATDGFAKYTLEYRKPNSSTWSPIDTSTTPVINGVLANWDTSGLADGWYFLRLTAESVCGQVSTDTRIVRVGTAVDTIRLDSPTPGLILGGNVCFDGTAWDQSCFDHYAVEFRPAGSTGSFSPVDPTHPTYPGTRVNQALATWDTVAQPDGDYEVRLSAADTCGNFTETPMTITVDNTPPVADITSPLPCDYVGGIVTVTGTALDSHLSSWVLQYTGGPASGWVTIASGTSPVVSDVLGQWDTQGLLSCAYALRLIVYDNAVVNCNTAINHRAEYTVTVNVGDCLNFDVNHDGVVDLWDFNAFLSAFTGP